MNEDFALYEEAMGLKGLGFDEPCFGYYDATNLEKYEYTAQHGVKNSDFIFGMTAPLYQQAFRWFRDKHNIISEIRSWNGTNSEWYFMIHNNGELLPWEWIENKSYEEAELACLKELISIVKNEQK